MNDIKYYLLFNPELSSLNKIDLLKEYNNDLLTNNRITSIKSFFIKYPDFDINIYKKNNPYTEKYSTINILVNAYQNINNNFQESNTKIAHIFVHFFKIGGGEAYLKNLNYWIKWKNENICQYIFVNKNFNNETLFKYDANIIYYSTYEELNKFLINNNFTIIIDHQLYWFEENATIKSFLNIDPFKIIRITHGVPIHHQNITNLNYSYSIELYNDLKSDVSWNNHIKLYKNIGVKREFNINVDKMFDTSNIKIIIVGRICENKVPIEFLKKLNKFCLENINYHFKFYGICDNTYKNIFLNNINLPLNVSLNVPLNVSSNVSSNISYNDYINPANIGKIYIENDILIHPSKSEAGATVILEAMSYGLPVICMNNGGMENALGNTTFLANDYDDLFNKLLSINENNYKDISQNNILKVLNKNNEKQLFLELIDDILLLNNINTSSKIPNIIHYIFGLIPQTEEFSFVYYISIYSAFLVNKPDFIFFHYQYEPYGYWWNKAKQYIKLNYVNCNSMQWGNKKIYKYAHKADKLRLEILLKYGGIYMDIDTISYKPYKELLDYDFVIGIQEENYKPKNITLYCNAILLAKKNSIFIKKWIESYEKHFNPNGWCEASVHLPHYIFKYLDDIYKANIKILKKEVFYYPSYDMVDKIFEKNNEEPIINDNLITLHLWNTYSEKYYKNIDWNCILKDEDYDSLYVKILKNVLIKYLNIDIKKIEYLNERSIIIYENIFNENTFNNIFLDLNNIEIIIIDNGTHKDNLYDLIYKNNDLKMQFLEKGINLKIIELNEYIDDKEICKNIFFSYLDKIKNIYTF